jgi:hypothetical protein
MLLEIAQSLRVYLMGLADSGAPFPEDLGECAGARAIRQFASSDLVICRVCFQNLFANLTMLATSRCMRYLSWIGSSGGRINSEKKSRKTGCKCGKIASRLIQMTDIQTVSE